MSIKKNLAYNISLNILNVLFPVITVPYVSRVLNPEGIGLANFAITYVSYFALFAALGISIYGVREIAKLKDRTDKISQIFSELFKITLISTLLVSAVFILTLYLVPQLAADRKIFLVSGLTLFFTPVAIDWYFAGLEQFKLITLRSVIIKLLCIAGLFLFVRTKQDVIIYVLLNVLAVVAGNTWNILYATRKGLKIKLTGIRTKPHLKPMLILFSSVLAVSIFVMLDTLMLGFMCTYEEVGFYTSAAKIAKLFIPIFSSLGIVLLPRLSYNRQNNKETENSFLLQKSFDFTIFLTVPAMFGLFLLASRFVPFFFGPAFDGAIVPLKILSALILIIGLNNLFGIQVLLGLNLDSKYLISVIIAAILNFCGNLILIPRYGSAGASVASVGAEIVQLVINIYIVLRFTSVRLNWRSVWPNVACSLPFIPIFYLANKYIVNDFTFLFVMCILCTLTYGTLQYLAIRHSLLRQYIDRYIQKRA